MRKATVVIILVLTTHHLSAQRLLRGFVRDSIGVLEGANVSVLNNNRSVHQVLSGRNGFVLRLLPGRDTLVTSFLGCLEDTTVVSDTTQVVTITLKHAANVLTQVVVRSRVPPVIVRNDTITFNAGTYATKPNATVEDLIRRLPGMEVDKDGNITMQGKKVDKIYIDGREIFLGDPRQASQNLPADIVAQVESYDSQSDQARFNRVKKPSATKTLNIKLKNNRKHGYAAKAFGGAGTAAYALGGNINAFAGKQSVFASINANNINNQFNGPESSNGTGTGINHTAKVNINYRDELSRQLVLAVSGGSNSNNTSLKQAISRKTFLSDSSLIENSRSLSKSSTAGIPLNAFLQYKPDSLDAINIRSSASYLTSTNTSSDTSLIQSLTAGGTHLINSAATVNTGTTVGWQVNNGIGFGHRFRKTGRTMQVNIIQSSSQASSTGSLYSQTNFTTVNQHFTQHTGADGYEANVIYTEPLSKQQVLDLSYSVNTNKQHSDKDSRGFDSLTGKYDIIDTLTTNRFTNTNTVQRIEAGFNTIDRPVTFQVGLAAQYAFLSSVNETRQALPLEQHFVNWYPRGALLWNMGSGRNLNINYQGRSGAPTIEQLQPLPDLSNPLLVKLGNPALAQQFTHDVDATFSLLNTKSFTNLQAGLNADAVQRQITASTVLAPGGVQQIQYVNADGVYHVGASITYGFPLGHQKHGTGSIHSDLRYGHDVSFINGAENITTGLAGGGGISLHYHATTKLFMDANVAANYAALHYSLPGEQNSGFWLQKYDADISYVLSAALTLSSNCLLEVMGEQGGLPARTTVLWNAALSRDFLRSRLLQLRLSAFDLLNTAIGVKQSGGANYISTIQSNQRGRLLLLSLVYSFRHFS